MCFEKKLSYAKNINLALRLWDRFFFMTLGVGPRQETERGNLASRLWERSLVRSRDQSLTGIPTSPCHRHMFGEMV